MGKNAVVQSAGMLIIMYTCWYGTVQSLYNHYSAWGYVVICLTVGKSYHSVAEKNCVFYWPCLSTIPSNVMQFLNFNCACSSAQVQQVINHYTTITILSCSALGVCALESSSWICNGSRSLISMRVIYYLIYGAWHSGIVCTSPAWLWCLYGMPLLSVTCFVVTSKDNDHAPTLIL